MGELQRLVAGSRESRLARWQTEHVAATIRALSTPFAVDVRLYKTTGDVNLEKPLAEVGGKSLFTKELDEALLRNEIDFAVHSLKDVPTELPHGLTLAAVLPRENYYDALVLPSSAASAASGGSAQEILAALPAGAVVGTSSPRRVAQLRRAFPTLRYESVRGNLDTRLAKLDRGDFHALVLADAGLRRLGLGARVSAVLAPPLLLPAVGQGALAVVCRGDDARVLSVLCQLACPHTSLACAAERAFLETLEGGCSVPVGVHVQIFPGHAGGDSRLRMDAVVLSEDGATSATVAGECAVRPAGAAMPDAVDLGNQLAHEVLASHPLLIASLRAARDRRESQWRPSS